jgi:hypothetical protein
VSAERRVVLQMLAAVVASCGLGDVYAACGAPFMDEIDRDAARELGQQYLRANALDAELQSIGSMVSGTRDDWQPIVDELRAAMRADYEAGRIVNLSGWFVSRTEARLLALTARRTAPACDRR